MVELQLKADFPSFPFHCSILKTGMSLQRERTLSPNWKEMETRRKVTWLVPRVLSWATALHTHYWVGTSFLDGAPQASVKKSGAPTFSSHYGHRGKKICSPMSTQLWTTYNPFQVAFPWKLYVFFILKWFQQDEKAASIPLWKKG